MKRIYLDQNKWIDLAAASKGLAKGEPFADALVLVRAAVAAGTASLPLSSAHYMETNARRHWRSRRDLAVVMADLSRMHTVAPADALVPPELDRALQFTFGRPNTVRPLQPFGVGASHAFAREIPRYRIPSALVPLVADRWGVEREANRILEMLLLAGPSPEDEAQLPGFRPVAHLEVAKRWAIDKETLRERRRSAGWNKGNRAAQVASAQAFSDYLDVINEALGRADISADLLTAGGAADMTAFLERVPTIFASSELERLRHVSSQKEWERQDLLDISALSVAAVYCDIVVTERFWVRAAQRARLTERFGTLFLRSLEDLPRHLV
jgi:hypothetical protein